MKRVWIDDECIACGACVDICPEVFVLRGEVAEVRQDADLSLETGIKAAADHCTVAVIHYEE